MIPSRAPAHNAPRAKIAIALLRRLGAFRAIRARKPGHSPQDRGIIPSSPGKTQAFCEKRIILPKPVEPAPPPGTKRRARSRRCAQPKRPATLAQPKRRAIKRRRTALPMRLFRRSRRAAPHPRQQKDAARFAPDGILCSIFECKAASPFPYASSTSPSAQRTTVAGLSPSQPLSSSICSHCSTVPAYTSSVSSSA